MWESDGLIQLLPSFAGILSFQVLSWHDIDIFRISLAQIIGCKHILAQYKVSVHSEYVSSGCNINTESVSAFICTLVCWFSCYLWYLYNKIQCTGFWLIKCQVCHSLKYCFWVQILGICVSVKTFLYLLFFHLSFTALRVLQLISFSVNSFSFFTNSDFCTENIFYKTQQIYLLNTFYGLGPISFILSYQMC